MTRAHVCRCGACSKGWFDLGGPAWRALTSNMPPGHVYGVRSRWVTCPPRCGQCYEVLRHYYVTLSSHPSLSRGNIQVYVKPGSDPWDARFQVIYNTACNFCQLDIITKKYLLNIF